MAYANFAIHNGQPSREDDLKNLSQDALKYLWSEARQAVDAMERELRRRGLQPVPPNIPKQHYDRIKFKTREINICGLNADVLTEATDGLKRALTTDYTNHQLTTKQAAAGKFLCHVTRNCGCEVALICFIAIGKHALERMKKEHRHDLLDLLKNNKSDLVVPNLVITIVTECGFPSDTTRSHDLDPAKEESSSRKRAWSNGEAFTFY
ncbi:hypothetical protein N7448_011315 [Penicillium atrosanguineum]|nr:hypothetical protein N7448_011315 [Penicillium atrosanguineum]